MKYLSWLIIGILLNSLGLSAQGFGDDFPLKEKSVYGMLQKVDYSFPESYFWSSYQINDTIIYNSPNLLRLFKNEAYHFLITFSFDQKKKEITNKNFKRFKYAIKIDVVDTSAFIVKTVSQTSEGVSVRGIAQGEVNTQTFMKFSVVDRKKQEIGGALFGLVIPGMHDDFGFTQYMHDLNPDLIIARDSHTWYSPTFETIDKSFFLGKKRK